MSEHSSLATPLSELDPADRALLELRFRRSLDDDELATLLGIERRDVERRYAGVLDHLAGPDAGARRRIEDELERELGPAQRDGESGPGSRVEEGRGTGGDDPRSEGRGRLVRLGGPSGGDGPRRRPAPRRWLAARRRARPAGRGRPRGGTIALGVLAAAVVATPFVIALSRTLDGPSNSAGQTARTDGAAPRPSGPAGRPAGGRGRVAGATASGPSSAPTRLRSVTAAAPDATGTARIVRSSEGPRLVLSFRKLVVPRETYELWLYNRPGDAVSLTRFKVRAERLTVGLPPGAGRFRFIDLSAELSTDGPGHDGLSVLRGPLPR